MREITSFAHWLKTHRRESGLTQDELAEKAGLSRTYVSALESGKVLLPLRSTRNKLHSAFETDDDELVDLSLLAWDEMGDEYVPSAERVKAAVANVDIPRGKGTIVRVEPKEVSPFSDERRSKIVERLAKIDIDQSRFIAFIGLIHAYDLEDGGAFEDTFFPDRYDDVPF